MDTAVKPPRTHVVVDNIHEALKAVPSWVAWRYVLRGGKWTKAPVDANTGDWGSSTKPATWCAFEKALQYHSNHPETTEGIGFVFSDADPFSGVDFDDYLDPETGTIREPAIGILKTLDSYGEVSPSRRGIKVFVRGKLPPRSRCKHPDLKIEFYSRDRFFTVTGNRLEGYPATIEDRQAELEKVHAQVFPAKVKSKPAPSARATSGGIGLSDIEIFERMRAAKNGDKVGKLIDGDHSEYGSHSEADLALCRHIGFYAGPYPDRINTIFRQTGLYREKWEREDYRAATIAKALEGRTEFYSPTRAVRAALNGKTLSTANGRYGSNGDGAAHATNGDGASGGDSDGPAGEDDKSNLTDLGNAERLVKRHGSDLLHCHPWGKWFAWDGRRFRLDDTGEITRRAVDTIKGLFAWAVRKMEKIGEQLGQAANEEQKAQLEQELAKIQRVAKWCLRSEAAGKIAAMVDLARSMAPVLPSDLDLDQFTINLLNGTLDLRTGKLLPHSRDDRITKLVSVEFDPSARCDLWLQFLDRIMDGNQDMVDFLQRVAGYCLTGSTREQCLFFLHGSGANGKSVFVLVLLALLGGDYAMQAPAELLMVRQGERHPTELADLHGRRLVACIEAEEGKRLAESLTKQLTGSDKIRARRMKEDFWEFDPVHKIFLAANHKPVIRNQDYGMWRRIHLIPFSVTIPPHERDKDLVDKLRGELPGILNWMVQGCLDWQRDGLGVPDEVCRATEEYKQGQDAFGEFLSDCCIVGGTYNTGSTKLYNAYAEWCKPHPPIGRNRFADALKSRGYENHRSGANGAIEWHGLTLRNS